MKKINLLILLCTLLTTFELQADEVNIQSLRGDYDINELSPEPEIKRTHDTEPLPRQFAAQPPLIPHSITGYKINLKFNKCLTCHSWSNTEKTDAIPVSTSHFFNRENNFSKQISARRYFCVQCHVTQVDAPELIENTYKAAEE